MRKLGLRARWAVPAGVVTVTGVVIAAAAVASAEATPSLAPRTAAQLLAEVAQGSKVPLGPLSATVQETSNLGLPELPSFAQQGGGNGPFSGGGSTSISIWFRDPQHFRVAEMVRAGETDLRLNGRALWVWDSKTQTATQYILPAHVSGVPSVKRNGLVLPRRHYAIPGPAGKAIPDTPQAAAAQLLKAVGPTTVVSVQRNIYVAGHAAYQVSLVPRSSKSLVGSVLIAIDAARHIPLRVQVYARASSTLAYSIGFTALTFGTPAASNFSFTPPSGATVRHVSLPSSPQAAAKSGLGMGAFGGLGLGPLQAVLGNPAFSAGAGGFKAPVGWRFQKMAGAKAGSLRVLPGRLPTLPKKALAKIKAQFARSLPKNISSAQRAKMIKMFDQQLTRMPKIQRIFALRNGGGFINNVGSNGGGFFGGNNGGGFINVHSAPFAAANANAPRVIGTSWLSVLATPPSPQVSNALKQALSAATSSTQQGGGFYGSSSSSVSSSSSGSSAYSSTFSASGPGIPAPAILQALLKASTPVRGSWGSGRLLQTTLLSVLITSKGQILAGAVTPAVLYADVARDAG